MDHADRVVAALRRRGVGRVIDRADPGFDAGRRVWNARIDRRPAAIVRPDTVDEVVATVTCAAEFDLPVAVRGGGHHVAGSAVVDDGIVLDLSSLDGVSVDPAGRTVTVGGGATWGAVDRATRAHGLAAVGGQDPNIGVAGLTLGGGVGWLSRAFGLAADNLLEAEVVTAEGAVVTASETTNADLFWGLRGAGGALGVVTAFTFRLHPVQTVLAGSLVFPIGRADEALVGYRALVDRAPDTVRPLYGLFDLPPSSPLVDRVDARRVAIVIVCAIEPFEAAEAVLEPLRALGPTVDTVTERAYADFQRAGESEPHARTALRSQYLETLTDEAIGTIVACGTEVPSAGATVFVSPRGGAEVEPAPDATAYPHRAPCHHVLVEARWDDPRDDAVHDRWVTESAAALGPFATPAASINFIDADEPADRLAAALGANHERVLALKRAWDPDDRFGAHARARWDG